MNTKQLMRIFNKKTILLILVLSAMFNKETIAQDFIRRRISNPWIISYGLGFTSYHGDLHDFTYDKFSSATGALFGLGLSRRIGSQFSMGFHLSYYTISGSDSANGALNNKASESRTGNRSGESDTRYIRNLSFLAKNFEFTTRASFDLIPVNQGYYRRPLINPYIFGGFGFSTNNPMADHETQGRVNLRHLNTEALDEMGYSGLIFIVPVGIGVKLKANQYIDIILETGRRFTFTDYLDDISTDYPSLEELTVADRKGSLENALIFFDRSAEGGYPARSAGNTRGNPNNNDAYYTFEIKLSMLLPYNWTRTTLNRRLKTKTFR